MLQNSPIPSYESLYQEAILRFEALSKLEVDVRMELELNRVGYGKTNG